MLPDFASIVSVPPPALAWSDRAISPDTDEMSVERSAFTCAAEMPELA